MILYFKTLCLSFSLIFRTINYHNNQHCKNVITDFTHDGRHLSTRFRIYEIKAMPRGISGNKQVLIYLVRGTSELFFCFGPFVFLGCIVLTFLFPLFLRHA